MSVLWQKGLRDLRGQSGRSASIVAALALGIAGLLAVLSSYAILTRALNDGYRASTPASATLRVDRLEGEAVRAAAAVPGVEAAEPRRTVRGRIKTGPAQWRNLVLFVRPDFETSRIATLALQRGAWPVGPDDLAIERDALQVARATVGDVVSVRTESGGEHTLRVTGSVHDVGQAQARMENLVYGYVTLRGLEALGEVPHYDELVLRMGERSLDERHLREVADRVKGALESRGCHVTRVDVPTPGEHPHAKLMGLLLLSIAVFGFFILALSGVLVFNLLTALLSGQVRQIGVMKALGGTRRRIASVYLFEAALLGVTAIAVGVPVGLAGGRWLCHTMAVLLNFDIASFAVPAWVFALVFAAGLLVPLVAAVIPVWRGTRVQVREALASNAALGRAFGASPIDRALTRASGTNRLLLLAVRNAARNRLRGALTLATLAAGGIFFMSALNVRRSLVHTVDRYYAASRADLSVALASDYPLEAVERAVRRVPAVTDAEAWSSAVTGVNGAEASEHGGRLTVIGLPVGSRMISFDLSMGEGRLERERAAVVNTALFDRLGRPAMGAAMTLLIGDQDEVFSLAGVSREPFAPPTAYVSRGFFDGGRRAGTANTLRIALTSTDDAALDAAKAAVEATLEQEGVRVVRASTKVESRYSFDQHMVMIYIFLLIVSGILGSVGALGLFTTVSLNVMERRRELGVLRALGATPARIAWLVLVEGVAIGTLGWLVAAVTVVPLTKLVGDLILRRVLRSGAEMMVALEPTGLVIWLVVGVVGSALASLWPARQASRVTVREALTYE